MLYAREVGSELSYPQNKNQTNKQNMKKKELKEHVTFRPILVLIFSLFIG